MLEIKIFKKKCKDELVSLVSKKNKAFVIVSHNLEVLKNYCNKLLWMEHGKVIQYGSFDRVRKIYAAK